MTVSINGSKQLVVKTLNAIKTDVFSFNNGDWVDVPGLSLMVNPTTSSNKILIMLNMQVAALYNNFAVHARLLKIVPGNSTVIYYGDASGSSMQGLGMFEQLNHTMIPCTATYLDSPATTSTVRYSAQVRVNNTSYTGRVNRTYAGSNSDLNSDSVSSLTLMEFAYA